MVATIRCPSDDLASTACSMSNVITNVDGAKMGELPSIFIMSGLKFQQALATHCYVPKVSKVSTAKGGRTKN